MPGYHASYQAAARLRFEGAIDQRVLIPGAITGGTLAVFEDIVEPGIGPARHVHHHQDETFHFVSGRFIAEIDGRLMEPQPGDMAYVPRGTVHAFRNVGETAGVLRFTMTPAGDTEAMFRAFHEAAKAGGMDADRMAEISLSYGQTFVGPPL